jgi:hypothetical protein
MTSVSLFWISVYIFELKRASWRIYLISLNSCCWPERPAFFLPFCLICFYHCSIRFYAGYCTTRSNILLNVKWLVYVFELKRASWRIYLISLNSCCWPERPAFFLPCCLICFYHCSIRFYAGYCTTQSDILLHVKWLVHWKLLIVCLETCRIPHCILVSFLHKGYTFFSNICWL